MAEAPDFRSDPSVTPEGKGLALLRWKEFSDNLPLDVIEDAFSTGLSPTRLKDVDPVATDEIAAAVVEDSDLIGFWVAWRRAGGFGGLEGVGGTTPPSSARFGASGPASALTPTSTASNGSASTCAGDGAMRSAAGSALSPSPTCNTARP